jgi:hypothetical protein
MSTDNQSSRPAPSTRNEFYALVAVLAGLLTVVAIYTTAILRWTTAQDVAAVVGGAGSIVGTIVGAYFGLQVGSAGRAQAETQRERAETQRDKAQERVVALTAALPPDQFSALRSARRDLFGGD